MYLSKDSWNEYLKTWSRLFQTLGVAALIALIGFVFPSWNDVQGFIAFAAVLALFGTGVLLYLSFWVLTLMEGD